MSNETAQSPLRHQTEQLLNGPLKHVRAAALAAALLPLASVAATPASAQTPCPSGGICGFVFNDTNDNGFQDSTESGIEGVKVFLSDGTDTFTLDTNPDGTFIFNGGLSDGTYTISVQVPQGTEPSPPNVGSDDFDSDGVPDGLGFSVATVTRTDGNAFPTDFGFFTKTVASPGTGTPGYWKNHPNAWPVQSITVGNVVYTKAQAIAWLGKVGKDKTTTMFSSLVPAMLNGLIGNDTSCVKSTIDAANLWMAQYGPVGSGVAASSSAWSLGEPLHIQMDNYNNGLLCAPHRN
jgi:hypothetical protein